MMPYNLRSKKNCVPQSVPSAGQSTSQIATTNVIPDGQLNCNQNQYTERPFPQEQQPHQQQQNNPPQQQDTKLPVKVPQQTKPPPSQQVKTDISSSANSLGQMIVDDPIKRSNSLNNVQAPEQKPAKKIPENALHMNPIMLLNHMHPSVKYEEVSKVGNPPHVQFTVKCTVMDLCFTGTGPNKKAARKQAAFAACSTVLGLQYPPEIWNEIPKKSVPIEVDESYAT